MIVHHRLRLLTFPMRTSSGSVPFWPITRPPGSRARSVHACQGLRPRRVERTLAISRPVVLPSTAGTVSAPRTSPFSRLHGWPACSPVNASRTASRLPAHELGANADRYSFIVMDFHHLLLAGLYRRSPAKDIFPPAAESSCLLLFLSPWLLITQQQASSPVSNRIRFRHSTCDA